MSIIKNAENTNMIKNMRLCSFIHSVIYNVATFLVFLTLFIFCLPAISQSSISIVSQPTTFSIDGIWENTSRFVEINSKNNQITSLKITLKPFYQYWYDGIYKTENMYEINSIARLADGLYLRYWIRGSAFDNNSDITNSNAQDGIFWRPGGNLKELSIDISQIEDTLTGYYILTTEEKQQVFEIRYWIANLDYSEELATIKLEEDSNNHLSLFVDKYLKINGTVYTCATGRRTTIRNVKITSNLPGLPVYSDDKMLMVLSDPYLVKSNIIDISTEIAKHNAIKYPPHSGKAQFVEPSIYKKIEDGELPLNGGSYFKPDTQDY
jgi:hypothetical protein